MKNLKLWYVRNQDKISWFIIGWLMSMSIAELIEGNYIFAAVNLMLAIINYTFIDWKVE